MDDVGLFEPNRRDSNSEMLRYRLQGFRIMQRAGMIWSSSSCLYCSDDASRQYFNFTNRRFFGGRIFECALANNNAASLFSVMQLHPATLRLIQQYERIKVQVVYIYVEWQWYGERVDASGNAVATAHATLLVVDTKRKIYRFFDPNGGRTWISGTHAPSVMLSRYDLMESPHNILIPGYRPHPERPTHGRPVQGVIEFRAGPLSVANAVPGGLCSPICFLILILCRRYAYEYPCQVANAVCVVLERKLTTTGALEAFRSNMVHWWKNMYGGNHQRLEKRVGLRDPHPQAPWHNRRCMVVSSRTGHPCQRPPCNRYALCWQHRRYLINNRPRAGKKCIAPITWTRALPSTPAVPVVAVSDSDSD